MNVAIIPARGGSRRIPRKNIRTFHGKPIIGYSIDAAWASGLFREIWVSTDDEEIGRCAEILGAFVLKRASGLAKDEVGTQEVTRDALLSLGDRTFDFACCIYATAPMLTASALQAAHLLLTTSGCNYVVPVASWLRDPGQFYFGRARAFLDRAQLLGVNTRLCPIDPATDCDINTEDDWQRAERMYAELHWIAA